MRRICALSLIVLLCGISLTSRAAEGDKELAEKAYGFLKKYCADCHHGEKPKSDVEDFDVLDYGSLTKKRDDGFYVSPDAKGDKALKQSRLWKMGGKKDVAGAKGKMPPKRFEGKEVKLIPTDNERVEILQKWLEAGATRFSAEPAEKSATPGAGKICADEPKPLLAADGKPAPDWDAVKRILSDRCAKCHSREDAVVEKFEVLDYADLTRARKVEERAHLKFVWKKDLWYYAHPGKAGANNLLADSLIWERVSKNQMPKGQKKLIDEEKAAIKRWLEAGAPGPVVEANRKPKSLQAVLTAIRLDLQNLPPDRRPFRRYFTLTHLHNQQEVTCKQLRLTRAAVSKLINSLSWEKCIHVPVMIDTEQTILAIDIDKLGWGRRNLWERLLSKYPYGLSHDDVSKELQRLSGSTLPYVRADWFVAAASRPPLYPIFLHLPEDAQELERQLRVDFEKNFAEGKLARSGYTTASTVVRGRRVAERQIARYGWYWKSYDFGPLGELGDLFRFPLGPNFLNHPFAEQAFKADGCEIIFNLPNGLQGYMVTNGENQSLPYAPPDLLKDESQHSGTPTIVTGISCMGCHDQGMRDIKPDQIRKGTAFDGTIRAHVEKIYPEPEKMKQYVEKSKELFLVAVNKTTANFLRPADAEEPISTVAALYREDLSLRRTAAELALAEEDLRKALDGNDLQALGLKRLLDKDGKLQREEWETLNDALSKFQMAAQKLGRGTPFQRPAAIANDIPSVSLKEFMSELAAKMKELLKGRKEGVLTVRFDGPAFPTSAGVGLQQLFAQQFDDPKEGFSIQPWAKLKLDVKYRLSKAWDSGSKRRALAVELQARVSDRFGTELAGFRFDRAVLGEETAACLLGASVELSPALTLAEREQLLLASLDHPKPFIRNLPGTPGQPSFVAAGEKSPYGLQVLVNDKSLQIENKKDLAFVNLKPNDIFIVRLINLSEHDAVAQLFVDGLSIFAYSEDRHKEGPKRGAPFRWSVLVPAKKTFDLVGWHRQGKNSDAFKVGCLPEGSSPVGERPNLGVITATFAAAWKKDAHPRTTSPSACALGDCSQIAARRSSRNSFHWRAI